MRVMQWITFAIILALAIGSFISASQPHSNNQTQNEMLNLPIHPFILGLFMSAINPVQIPFWFGWSTVLFSKKILEPKNNQYNFYIVGIGMGTLCGNAVFIFGGKWLVNEIPNSGAYLNWIIGGIFATTALIQLIKILTKKTPKELSWTNENPNA